VEYILHSTRFVLGPLLFIIYVDGVSSVTLADGTVVLFADDMVLYRPLYTPYDYELLQREIAHWISNVRTFTVQHKEMQVHGPLQETL